MRKLFGTDGIRGRANAEPLTPELALRFGRAVVGIFGASVGRSAARLRIAVGRDTRRSCDMLESAVIAGICSAGADVLLLGVLPTPAVALLTRELCADVGVMISASHNSFEDNGLKVFASDGFKLADAQEETIEELVTSAAVPRPTGAAVGVVRHVADASSRYLARLETVANHKRSLDGLKLVVDCANGAAYKVAPSALRARGAQVIEIGVEPDGSNINARCGAMHPQMLQERVLKEHAQLGVALDGDADRLVLVDELGSVVDGDQVLAILAAKLHSDGGLRGAVVGTVMTNMGLELALRKMGVPLKRTQVGDRYVVEELRRSDLVLGGEPSGHIVYLPCATTGDGLLAALLVAQIMVERGLPLGDLRKVMIPLPQKLINVRVRERLELESNPAICDVLRRVTKELTNRGRILVRYSGTEPLVRIMVEGEDENLVAARAREVAAVIEAQLGADDSR